MKRITVLFLLFLTLTGGAVGAQQAPVALIGARVLPVSGPPLNGATVLIADGKIAAVGTQVTIPTNARRIDLHGHVLIPGLVDARSALFLSPERLGGNGTADQDVLDAADLFEDDAARVRAHGVTTIYLSPGSRGGIGGLGAVVKLIDPTRSAAENGAPLQGRPLKTHAALQLALGLSSNGRSSSLERLNSYEALRTAFHGAEQYARSLERYQRDLRAYEKQMQTPKAGEKRPAPPPGNEPTTGPPDRTGTGSAPPAGPPMGRPAEAAPVKPVKPRPNPAMDVLVSALKGEIPVRIEAYRTDDILNALRLADEFKLKLILERATEGAAVAAEIARRKIPVVWGPTLLSDPPRLETLHHDPDGAAVLAKAGVKFALITAGDSGLASRFLLDNAAAAGGFGLDPQVALRAVTLNAAEILGVADRVGSIQVGKDADLVVLNALPWEPMAHVEKVFVEGAQVYPPAPGK